MAYIERIHRRLVPLVQEGIIENPAIAPSQSNSGREAFTVTIRPAKTTKLPMEKIGEIVREAASDLDVEIILELIA